MKWPRRPLLLPVLPAITLQDHGLVGSTVVVGVGRVNCFNWLWAYFVAGDPAPIALEARRRCKAGWEGRKLKLPIQPPAIK
jgi:hypothetical protein